MTTPIPIQVAIFEALAGFGGLNTVIGSKVYPDIAPQEAVPPLVVWQEISLVQANDLGGSAETGGLSNYRIQITSWARGSDGATQARRIDAQVKLAMISAAPTNSPTPEHPFRSLILDTRALPYEPDTKRHGVQSDFSVWLKT